MYRFIQEQSQYFPVLVLCQTLEVNRSGYYEWLKPTATSSTKDTDSVRIKVDNTQQIKDLFGLHQRRYGSRRLVSEMKDRGVKISRDFVRRVLVENQLRPIQPRSFVPRTTDSRHTMGYSPNLLLDRPRPTGPNQVWVSDITYIPLANGKWLYLAVWLDLWSRRVVGWCLADHMRDELVITALRRALLGRQPANGLILHSDRGSQYASKDFSKLLAGKHLRSMSRAGECYDNATAESFWSRLKAEVLELGVFLSLDDARAEIGDYIDNYYNVVRKHSSLQYCSPVQFESKHISQN
ncbi:IS3 family transposase [Spirosoma utsteinense]|uniref:Transposase InsO family protein n=1 Tax=Spirosoma utsteinense TaxID=2585773 RepID=A0ABR6WF52_9BACT|nr:IS3 family transposase [Spirosoma utsteinense]MBC3789216.1 transposase InsO family protein [Spirosoma utsteinense]MBC3795144.1 transposase InsO family protein [Spirosoma utsteinense]